MRYLFFLFVVGSIIFVSCDAEKSTAPSQIKKNPVVWTTNWASLKADDFFITTANDTFYANNDSVNVGGDGGGSTYCTLEIEWYEHGVQMRLYIYFHADSSQWWSEQFRTYNGEENAQWYYYYGDFFRSPLGDPYAEDFEATSDSMYNQHDTTGHVHMEGLQLQAFTNR